MIIWIVPKKKSIDTKIIHPTYSPLQKYTTEKFGIPSFISYFVPTVNVFNHITNRNYNAARDTNEFDTK